VDRVNLEIGATRPARGTFHDGVGGMRHFVQRECRAIQQSWWQCASLTNELSDEASYSGSGSSPSESVNRKSSAESGKRRMRSLSARDLR
jgi:hypothetical protein